MGKMDEKESSEFLKLSGYMTMRKRMLCSCTMKEFLELLENKITVNS